jgi:quinol monooxygenase YgiN
MKISARLSASAKFMMAILTMQFLTQNADLNAQHLYQKEKKATLASPKYNQTKHREEDKVAARLIRYEVKPEYLSEFSKAVCNYVLHSYDLKNNVLSEAYYEQENPSVLWIIERWSSRRELEKGSKSLEFKAIQSLSENALIGPAKVIRVKDLEQLSKQQWRSTAVRNDKPITIMLFVDAKAGTEGRFKEVYHAAMPQFRSESGVITYQLSQLEEDSTQFVTYEKFRGETAFQYHLNFPPIQPVIDYLTTSIKKQPFQSGLHRLMPLTPDRNN